MNADPIEDLDTHIGRDGEEEKQASGAGDGGRPRAATNGGSKTNTGVENDEAHLELSRWWFASSAIPMIAGTLGPVANAFSICALVRPWRQNFPPGSNVDAAIFMPDPIWLTVVNAIQVAMALIANVVLLLNMAKKIRFSIAQPLTIVAWYVSSICLIALCGTAGGPLIEQPESQYIWSQAFWYGIWAAILYFTCSTLMCITFWGAMKGHYDKDFQLTTSQRTLMLQTIMFLMYLLIGALVFSTIEGWEYLDAVYWANVTLFTVGFGDFSAATPLGRGLLLPYALVGVISLGLVIGSIRSLVLDRGKRRLDARMMEKKRRKVVRRMTKKGRDDILEPIDDGNGSDGAFAPQRSHTNGWTEYERREKEFEIMRSIQEKTETRRRWVAFGSSTTTWVILWVVGAAIFQQCELPYQGWSYFDGFYFAFVTLTTIGYGDVTPISPAGKSFFVFWALLALPAMTIMISNAGDTVVKFVRDATDKLGMVTILPGEKGFSKDWKEILRYLSFGKIDLQDSQIDPPGFLGEAQPRRSSNSSSSGSDSDGDDEERRINSAKFRDAAQRGRNADRSVSPNEKQRSTDQSDQKKVSQPSSSSSNDQIKDITNERVTTKDFAKNDKSKRVSKKRRDSAAKPTSGEPNWNLPDNMEDYHVVLIEEICTVTQHLKEHPPHKYSFQEWAWYLKLIGEDEESSESHRKPSVIPGRKLFKSRPAPKRGAYSDDGFQDSPDTPEQKGKRPSASHTTSEESGSTTKSKDKDAQQQQRGTNLEQVNGTPSAKADKQTGGAEEPTRVQWSWIGSRSPLMGSQEESEWILEKLQARLAESLKAQRDGGNAWAANSSTGDS